MGEKGCPVILPTWRLYSRHQESFTCRKSTTWDRRLVFFKNFYRYILLHLAYCVGLKAIFWGSCVLIFFFCSGDGSYFCFLGCGFSQLFVNISEGRVFSRFRLQGKVGAMYLSTRRQCDVQFRRSRFAVLIYQISDLFCTKQIMDYEHFQALVSWLSKYVSK